MSKIGKNIRTQRESLGMTVSKLADCAGVHRNTITNYESGKTTPDVNTFVKIANAMGLSVLDLAMGKVPPPFAMCLDHDVEIF